MNRRRRLSLAAALVTGALMTVGLSGCFGEPPAPSVTPSPTGFASAEEAYAAAEETYRDYIDALNLRNEGRVGPDPYQFLTGDLKEQAITEATQADSRGERTTGRTTILDFGKVSATTEQVEAQVCMDASGTRVVDASGTDITPVDRIDNPALSLKFSAQNGELKLYASEVIALSC